MTIASDPTLQVLLDKQEIHEVLMRYCRGVDRCDEELIRSTYHSDGTDEHGPVFKGNGWDFAKQIVPWLRDHSLGSMHFMGNELIEVHDDAAQSEVYFVAYHRLQREDGLYDLVFGGRYVDRFERREGAWKIAKRVCVHDWSRVDPVGEDWPEAAHFRQGLRSRDDIAFAR